jgi:hypothetical protein
MGGQPLIKIAKRVQVDFFKPAPFFLLSPSAFSIFLLQDAMRSNPAKEHLYRRKLKGGLSPNHSYP